MSHFLTPLHYYPVLGKGVSFRPSYFLHTLMSFCKIWISLLWVVLLIDLAVIVFLYADDLILASISICDLQALLNVVLDSFHFLDLLINTNKSVCLRIGPRYNCCCSDLSAYNSKLTWVDEAKYLGVYFKCSKKFSCNWQAARSAYYKALNGILSVLGSNPNIHVALSLVRAGCMPLILYGLASTPLSAADVNLFTFVYNNIFSKLFNTKD